MDLIKPQKVIFFFIESFNHVALNVACKVKNIPTYHLEHGVRFSVQFYQKLNQQFNHEKNPASFISGIKNFRMVVDKYRNRRFYTKTILESPIQEREFLKHFFLIRKENSIFKTFQLIKSNLRLPDTYISFSPYIFNFHKELEQLPDDYPVKFIGIPQFDNLSLYQYEHQLGENVLFIDQPLHEQSIFGWTQELKKKYLKQLAQCTTTLNLHLFIKPHPLNDLSIYQEWEGDTNVTILQGNWHQEVKKINTVLGFTSTLLLPFIAMKNKNCFLLEMHPEPGNEPYSQFLLNSKACHAVLDFNDLSGRLNNWQYWNEEQGKHKNRFIHNYMYKFDGKASERLKQILLDKV